MEKEINFISSGVNIHATVWIFEDKTYEVTECYYINEDCESVDVDCEEFIPQIEEALCDQIIVSNDGQFGGCDNYFEGVINNQ